MLVAGKGLFLLLVESKILKSDKTNKIFALEISAFQLLSNWKLVVFPKKNQENFGLGGFTNI
jgi:hypothetical protein